MYVCILTFIVIVTHNLELMAGKCDLSQESTAINDSCYYSTVRNQPNVKHIGNVVYKVSKHIHVMNSFFACFVI